MIFGATYIGKAINRNVSQILLQN